MESTDSPNATPDLDRSAPGFEKLHNIPAIYYKQWLEKHGGKLDGADVLDFGSGEGLVSVGLSTFCGARSVRGVDICRDFERVEAALDEVGENLIVPSNVVFEQIQPGASLGTELYDVIVSWSVLEHVEQEIFDHQMKVLSDALRPGGFGIFQMAPLFYSPYGSHLFGAHEPWRHLTMQHNLLERQIRGHLEKPRLAHPW